MTGVRIAVWTLCGVYVVGKIVNAWWVVHKAKARARVDIAAAKTQAAADIAAAWRAHEVRND